MMRTDIPKLESLLGDGIKERHSVLFCTDPAVANQEFAYQLLFTCLSEGHKGL